MVRLPKLFLAAALALSVSLPALADGRKGKPNFIAPPVPPLRAPEETPPQPLPPPTPIQGPKEPNYISLPANFGGGGVGIDITGDGYFAGGRVIIADGGSARASTSAFAFAFAQASAFASARANAQVGGHIGGHAGGCGCAHH